MDSLVEALFETGSIIIKDKAPLFTWASGIQSPIYCDNRRLLSYPKIRESIIQAFCEKIKIENIDAIAGVATAGVPWAALIAGQLSLPLIYVRGEAKKHGKENMIEGDIKNIKNVILIEDLISTGKSSLKAVDSLLAQNIQTQKVLSLFSYNLKSAQKNFENKNISYHSLKNIDDLLDSTFLSQEQIKLIEDFRCL